MESDERKADPFRHSLGKLLVPTVDPLPPLAIPKLVLVPLKVVVDVAGGHTVTDGEWSPRRTRVGGDVLDEAVR